MRLSEVQWDGNDNVKFIMDGSPETHLCFKVKDVQKLRVRLNKKKARFIHLYGVSINRDKVKYVLSRPDDDMKVN